MKREDLVESTDEQHNFNLSMVAQQYCKIASESSTIKEVYDYNISVLIARNDQGFRKSEA
ncbi:hypothetical protein DPMN_167813 [Dreissena polymorpha]|uniref:Uncharacterized protein n=1 Tax=Dreissena polymorpha TaxID=45954 RepID=A0A9D4F239_DREPO|nr:hypothetical protein DPMN_167813 [Dreissena polymorpha]